MKTPTKSHAVEDPHIHVRVTLEYLFVTVFGTLILFYEFRGFFT